MPLSVIGTKTPWHWANLRHLRVRERQLNTRKGSKGQYLKDVFIWRGVWVKSGECVKSDSVYRMNLKCRYWQERLKFADIIPDWPQWAKWAQILSEGNIRGSLPPSLPFRVVLKPRATLKTSPFKTVREQAYCPKEIYLIWKFIQQPQMHLIYFPFMNWWILRRSLPRQRTFSIPPSFLLRPRHKRRLTYLLSQSG